MTEKYDLFVIGAGSGGVRAARIAARHGAKVGIAESGPFGGTCVNAGCVPKKLMVYASEFSRHFEDARNYGWSTGKAQFDWKTLIANKDSEIQRLNSIYETLLKNNNVDIFKGHARFIDAHTVEIGGQRIQAEKFLIATGGRPKLPQVPGKEHIKTSDDMFHLPALPRHIVITGGGYIGAEFAGIFSGLGVRVTLLHRGEKLLGGFDGDIRASVGEEMAKSPHTALRFKTEITKVNRQGAGYIVHTTAGDKIECDLVLAAIGRVPLTENLGLENTGVKCETDGRVRVNNDHQTDEPHIYAVGDVCNQHNLTPVAIGEGHALADRLMGHMLNRTVDYEFIASAVFSHPPAATVGLSEENARDMGLDVAIYRTKFRPMKHTITGRDEKTMMKLVVDKKTDLVLGFHMVGESAPEIIQLAATLLKKNVTKKELDETIGVHPTAAEEFVTMREPVGP